MATSAGFLRVPRQGMPAAVACPRCGGLMVGEACEDVLDLTGPEGLSAWRCVQCGEFIDPVVLQNRRRQQTEPGHSAAV